VWRNKGIGGFINLYERKKHRQDCSRISSSWSLKKGETFIGYLLLEKYTLLLMHSFLITPYK
jgi:hypothetical protein